MIFQKSFKSHYYVLMFFSLFFLFLNGCGSDDSDKNKTQSQVVLNTLPSQLLYETGIETFAIGVSGDDPAATMQGISLLEQAVIASPDEITYLIDLADAYMASGIVLQYPYAVDIYWMLYNEGNQQKDALLVRLAEAYAKAGNYNAAFEVAMIRLSEADDKQVDNAALHLTLLAMSNNMFDKAAKALIKKAGKKDNSAYLLLLAASLKEASGDVDSSVKLLDKTLKDQKNTKFFELVYQAKQRMKP